MLYKNYWDKTINLIEKIFHNLKPKNFIPYNVYINDPNLNIEWVHVKKEKDIKTESTLWKEDPK